MHTLPPAMILLLRPFAPLFSRRVWHHVQVLLTGAILAPAQRTVTAALRVMGLGACSQFQRYHRVLNRDHWSSLAVSGVLLGLLVTTFAPQGPLVVGVDETVERRRGAKIAAKGISRDAVRSSHSHFVKASGLRPICLMVLVPIPWAKPGALWADGPPPFSPPSRLPSGRMLRQDGGTTPPPIGHGNCGASCGAGIPSGQSSPWRTAAMRR